VLLEFEGPYHFIKDEYYMMQEYQSLFTDFNKQARSADMVKDTKQFLLE
jgi:hypothetical protein